MSDVTVEVAKPVDEVLRLDELSARLKCDGETVKIMEAQGMPVRVLAPRTYRYYWPEVLDWITSRPAPVRVIRKRKVATAAAPEAAA